MRGSITLTGSEPCCVLQPVNATIIATPKRTTEIAQGLWGQERKVGPFLVKLLCFQVFDFFEHCEAFV